jgi:hypothetical protein
VTLPPFSLTRTTEPLAPGRYTEPTFVPRISFQVGDGWFGRQLVEGFFDVQRNPDDVPGVIAVQFARPSAAHVADDDAVPVRKAAQVIAALDANEGLHVRHEPAAGIDGQPAASLDVDYGDPGPSAPAFRPIIRIPAGPISIAPGRRLRLHLLDLPDGPLAVLVGGSIEGWEAALAAASPVLDSIRFETAG